MGQSDCWVTVIDFLLPHSLISFNLASRSLDVAFLAYDFVHLGSEMNKATWAERNMGVEEAISCSKYSLRKHSMLYNWKSDHSLSLSSTYGLHTTVCFKHTIGNAVAPQTNQTAMMSWATGHSWRMWPRLKSINHMVHRPVSLYSIIEKSTDRHCF